MTNNNAAISASGMLVETLTGTSPIIDMTPADTQGALAQVCVRVTFYGEGTVTVDLVWAQVEDSEIWRAIEEAFWTRRPVTFEVQRWTDPAGAPTTTVCTRASVDFTHPTASPSTSE